MFIGRIKLFNIERASVLTRPRGLYFILAWAVQLTYQFLSSALLAGMCLVSPGHQSEATYLWHASYSRRGWVGKSNASPSFAARMSIAQSGTALSPREAYHLYLRWDTMQIGRLES